MFLDLFATKNGFWPWLQTKDDADFNIFLRLGNFEIAWYAVIILGGAIICSVIAYYMYLKHLGLDFDTLSEGLALGLLFGILGARLYYVIFNFDLYKNNLLDIVKIWNGGLAIHGGIIAGALTIYFYSKKKGVSFLKLLVLMFLLPL